MQDAVMLLFTAIFFALAFLYVKAVSYTHLDVYKRQDQEYIISLLGGCLHGIRSQLSANPLHP